MENTRVKICEMSLRDGMQVVNRRAQVPLGERLELAAVLQDAGLPYLEVGSFVSHKVMPSMADTPELLAALTPGRGETAALIPTLRQYERARAAPNLDTVALLASASEAYSQINTRMSVAEALEAAARVAAAARADGKRLRAYLSYAFRAMKDDGGGEVQPAELEPICRRLSELGCETIALSDTDGRATPRDVERVTGGLAEALGLERIGVHLHDRYGLGMTNAYVAYQAGVRTFDCSVAGVGGNPQIPHAVGNLATEELVHLFHALGVETGIDEDALLKAGRRVVAMLDRVGDPPTTSKLLLARL